MVDIYLYNIITTKVAGPKYKSGYNIQMVRHIEKEENIDNGDLVNIGVFKPMNRNMMKQLRILQEIHESTKSTTNKTSKVAKMVIK